MSRILTYEFEGHDLNENRIPILILLALEMTQLSNVWITDNFFDSTIIGDQNIQKLWHF